MRKIALFALMAFAVPMFAQAPAQENPPKVEKTKKTKKTSKKKSEKKEEKKAPEAGK
jgi:ribosomal protein L12E/L44/L45/RPP1/RPP2